MTKKSSPSGKPSAPAVIDSTSGEDSDAENKPKKKPGPKNVNLDPARAKVTVSMPRLDDEQDRPQKNGGKRMNWTKYPSQHSYLSTLVTRYYATRGKARKDLLDEARDHICDNMAAGLTRGEWNEVSFFYLAVFVC